MLYCGATNDLYSRIFEHKHRINRNSFTARYNVDKLVYYECFENVEGAFAREAQIKSWTRNKKENLIEKDNPQWADLSDEILSNRIIGH